MFNQNLQVMGKTMLEYSKVILEKVSFDARLFQKEWGKAINYLLEHEVRELERWVRSKFSKHWEPQPALALGK